MMHFQLAFLLAPITFLTTINALPQNAQPSSTAQASDIAAQNATKVATTALGMDVNCYDERDAASISDCSKAMMAFPQNLDNHYFHTGGPSDIYQLPAQRSVGQCIMRIELVSDQAEFTSWLAIGTVALQLTMACANQRLQFGFGVTGGFTNTGVSGLIRVTLKKATRSGNQDTGPSYQGNSSLTLPGATGQVINGVPKQTSTS